MPGPITQQSLELLGHKISTVADKAASVGAQVDEVREWSQEEIAKIEGRLHEHSTQRDADRHLMAGIKTDIAILTDRHAASQKRLDSIYKVGWLILGAAITSTVGAIVAAVFFALTHYQEKRTHDHEAFDPRVDRVRGALCRDRMQDDQLTANHWTDRTSGSGDRR